MVLNMCVDEDPEERAFGLSEIRKIRLKTFENWKKGYVENAINRII
jgi:hypothetical protein